MVRHTCPTDPSDAAWAILPPLLPQAKRFERPRTPARRAVLNALSYWLRSGEAWRLLPQAFPRRKTVCRQWRAWRLGGDRERIHTALCERVRVRAGRAATLSAGIIDSQSVKTTERGPAGSRGQYQLRGKNSVSAFAASSPQSAHL